MIGDRAWIEGALARLISTSSLSGQEAAAQQFVEQMMREVGADAVRRVFVDAGINSAVRPVMLQQHMVADRIDERP